MRSSWQRTIGAFSIAVMCIGFAVGTMRAQAPTDSAAQASPIKPAPTAPATDSASQASPIPAPKSAAVSIAPHTAIRVKLESAIDSGHLTNGQTLHATLADAIPLSPRGTLPAGTPAALTVIETLPAGRISSAGEFSLQALRIGSSPVSTDTLTYRGRTGHKDLPDSAAAVGTDAGLAAGAELTFHVLSPPVPATGPPPVRGTAPGSIDGRSSGGPPPPGSSSQSRGAASRSRQPGNSKPTSNARQVTPPDTTMEPAQNAGQPSTAPNQPAPPGSTTPASPTQPR